LEAGSAFRVPTFRNYLLGEPSSGFTPGLGSASLIEKEKLEKATLDVNVSQRLREEKPSRRMVHTRVDRLAWDCQLSPNPHALTIYLEFVLACGVALERFEKCQCEDNNVHLHCRT